MKKRIELDAIGVATNSAFLVWQNFMCRMSTHFWMRDYVEVAKLSEKHSETHPSSQQKRILQIFRTFHEGIAYLNLARDTKQAKWRIMGQKAVVTLSQHENTMCKFNFENKSKLLQAELHYLDGDLISAETAYKASIKSAGFIHEQALAYELYGIFCVENNMVDEGSKQLCIAVDKYKEWGAVKKADEVQLFIDLVDPIYLHKLKLL